MVPSFIAYKIRDIWAILATIKDPEIPVISLQELGILRDIRALDEGFEIVITPTYSGCPAMGQIADDIQTVLESHGIKAFVKTQLSPAWTTDWMSEEAKLKLRQYGIAPPQGCSSKVKVVHFMKQVQQDEAIICPLCGSKHTVVSSAFGSTACKALYKCLDCQEPFDYFKPY